MRKTIVFSLSLLASAMLPAQERNVLRNPNFDGGTPSTSLVTNGVLADNWSVARSSMQGNAGYGSQLIASGGEKYVQMVGNACTSTCWGQIYQLLDQPGNTEIWTGDTRYRVTFKLRAEAPLNDDSRVAVELSYFDPGTSQYTQFLAQRIDLGSAPAEWKGYTTNIFSIDTTHYASAIGNKIKIAITGGALSSNINIDDVTLETVGSKSMLAPQEEITVGNNLTVPNWFKSTENGTTRKATGARQDYYLYIPAAISKTLENSSYLHIVSAGNHALTNTIGGIQPPYVVQRQDIVEIGAEEYVPYKITPDYDRMHNGDLWAGPIYIESSMADGTRSTILYQTKWSGGESLLRPLNVVTRTFPDNTGKIQNLHVNMWTRLTEELGWPDFFDAWEYIGFNYVTVSYLDTRCVNDGTGDPCTRLVDSSEATGFLGEAGARGLKTLQLDSPLEDLADESEALTGQGPKRVSPCYRGQRFTDLINASADLSELLTPQLIYYDIEIYASGVADSITTNRDIHCPSENATSILLKGADIVEQLKLAREDRGIVGVRTGLYGTSPGGIYQQLFKFNDLYPAGLVDFAQPPFYFYTPKASGEVLRGLLKASPSAVPRNTSIPWIDAGQINNEYTDAQIFDRALQMTGSGAQGLAVFSFQGMQGVDYYYLSKALETLGRIDRRIAHFSLLADDMPIAPTGDPRRQLFGASLLANAGSDEFIMLVSSFDDNTKAYGYRQNPYSGEFTVVLPVEASVVPIDLSTGLAVGDATDESNEVVFDFAAGVPGARSNLIYLCNPVLHSCDTADEDSDGLAGFEDNCPLTSNQNQTDVDGNGIGDACQHGLTGAYYDNLSFSGGPRVVRVDGNVDFNWDFASPASGIPVDDFTVRWTGRIVPPVTGSYEFCTSSDDGVQLWVDDTHIINQWVDQAETRVCGIIALTQDQPVSIKLNFFDTVEEAIVRLYWSYPGQAETLIPSARLYAE